MIEEIQMTEDEKFVNDKLSQGSPIFDIKPVKKKQVKCFRCNYKWFTKSKMIYTSCPNCYGRVRNIKYEQKKPQQSINQDFQKDNDTKQGEI